MSGSDRRRVVAQLAERLLDGGSVMLDLSSPVWDEVEVEVREQRAARVREMTRLRRRAHARHRRLDRLPGDGEQPI